MKKFTQWVEANDRSQYYQNMKGNEILRYKDNWCWEEIGSQNYLFLKNVKEEIKIIALYNPYNAIIEIESPNILNLPLLNNYEEAVVPVKYRGRILDLIAFGLKNIDRKFNKFMFWKHLLVNSKLQEEVCKDKIACKMFIDYINQPHKPINTHELNDYLQDTNRDGLLQCFLKLEQFLEI